jgi:chromosome segregation ATPase
MLEEKRKVNVNGQEVVLDSGKLFFSEGTLDNYLEVEGGWIDYFGAKLADAERQLAEWEMKVEIEEDEYERVYARVFSTIKSTEGGSDKLVEGQTKIEATVVAAKTKVQEYREKAIAYKHAVNMLKQHLRAWDKNHENAQNRGNTLRKEMERLHKDRFLDDKIDDIIKHVDV